MKLSIIIPVYNEESTLSAIVGKVLNVDIDKEIIIVDDGSQDKTKEILQTFKDNRIKILHHLKNLGKGAAIRTAIDNVSGHAVLIQDADLEYDPGDYLKLWDGMIKNRAHVVYGSRFLTDIRCTSLWHYGVNSFLTRLTNLLYGTHLTDMETCYKLIRIEVIKGLLLSSCGFEIEAEITLKLAKQGFTIFEVPINYHSRSYHSGKKIKWTDALKTIATLIKYKFKR